MSDSRDAFNNSAPVADPIVWDQVAADSQSAAAWNGPGAFDPPAAVAPALEPSQQAPWAGAAPTAERVHHDWQAGRTKNPEVVEPVVYDVPASAEQPAAAPERHEPEPEPQADDALSIGRSRGNSIVLDDMLVSRQHVRITADSEGLVLEDLGSRNGTFVNGRRVARTHLHEGDRIGVGGTTFEVRDGWLVTI